jgi:hypothetical protein
MQISITTLSRIRHSTQHQAGRSGWTQRSIATVRVDTLIRDHRPTIAA